MNIATAIEGHDPGATALFEDDAIINYGHLGKRVANVRAALAFLDIAPGSRVLFIGENEVDFVLAVFAALGLGAEVAPIRSSSPMPEIDRKVQAVAPDLVVLCATAAWVSEGGGGAEPEISVADAEQRGGELDVVEIAERGQAIRRSFSLQMA